MVFNAKALRGESRGGRKDTVSLLVFTGGNGENKGPVSLMGLQRETERIKGRQPDRTFDRAVGAPRLCNFAALR